MLKFAHFEGKIVPSGDAKISLASHVIQYGTGVFSGLRGYFVAPGKVRLFRVNLHHERMMEACKIFGMDFEISLEDFCKALEELIIANKPEGGFYIRPIIYSDDEELTPCFHKLSYKIGFYMIALGDYLDTMRGLRLMVSSWKKFSDGSISTKAKACGAYLHASAARTEANRCGYDEALVMDDRWNIVEGSAANMMIVKRGEVFIPPASSAMLGGITLRSLIEFLEEEGVKIRYEAIDRSMVYTADEVLLTGSGAQIVFAQSVDDRKIGDGNPGMICQMLRQKYDSLVAMKHPWSKEWMSEITY